MDQEVKTRWVEALHSGKYTQGQTKLRNTRYDDNDSFCCLGVLCDVLKVSCRSDRGMNYYQFGEEYYPSESHEEVPAKFCGLTDDNINTLINMNDSSSKSFTEIANYIETEL
jgi:hypothetical protein